MLAVRGLPILFKIYTKRDKLERRHILYEGKHVFFRVARDEVVSVYA
jgi:hypothetical protein